MAFKVLVADDSITIHKLVSLALKEEDVEIYTVSNGFDAVEKIKEIKPDVVLADIFMPRKTGYEVCSFVKSNPELSYIPVVLMVGTFEPFDEDEAKNSGYDGVLVKPFETEQLLQIVRSSIQKSLSNRSKDGDSHEEYLETSLDETVAVDEIYEEDGVDEVEREIPGLETHVKTVKAKVEEPELKSMESVIAEHTSNNSFSAEEFKPPSTGELDILDIPAIEIGKESFDEDEDILGVREKIGFIKKSQEVSVPSEDEIFVGEVEEKEEKDEEELLEVYEETDEDEEEVILVEEGDFSEKGGGATLEKLEKEEVEVKEVKEGVATSKIGELNLNDKIVEEITKKVVEKISVDVVEKIAWEVVPELAELLIKKNIENSGK